MKQIIPFKKELLFKTKISEITSISLEHTLSLRKNHLIKGEFHISGDYKMTEASINREKFYYTLPFEIDLDDTYDTDTINIDIDNFYYEVVNDDSLQVNIDVYVDGEKKEIIETKEENIIDDSNTSFFKTAEEVRDIILSEEDIIEEETRDNKKTTVDIDNSVNNEATRKKKKPTFDIDNSINNEEEIKNEEEYESNIDYHNITNKKTEIEQELLSDIEDSSINIENKEIVNNNINKNNVDNINIFDSNLFSDDTYATYYVYVVKEDDNIDKILEKFTTTKEELANYNDLENVHMGTKLIIPSKNE